MTHRITWAEYDEDPVAAMERAEAEIVVVDDGDGTTVMVLSCSPLDDLCDACGGTGRAPSAETHVGARPTRQGDHPPPTLYCAHGRPGGALCPWCTGINGVPGVPDAEAS